ncbi:cadherin EGF LAG seven-pass G-type receptor 2 [Aplysia californica]|uniref:Cadherin EGF LAG seven-pass G-type receptor 2 n=1 Tax=Aplysia californica TaxID=6500 RepID=A0ABM1AA60_APLCA|nr:cadherin EGF LAG seven-pass G-type receptor 2 [Aplysia californica]
MRSSRGVAMTTKMPTLMKCLLSIAVGSAILTLCDAQDPCPSETFYFKKVPENIEVGAVVFTLKLRGPREDVALSATENEYFWFDAANMTVVVNKTIDVDIVADGLSAQSLFIMCRDIASGQGLTIELNFDILNVNDNKPVFEESIYNITIGEMTELETSIVTNIRATDEDARSRVYYVIPEGFYADYFRLRDTFSTVLVLQKHLDFETLPEFSITLMAMDGQQGSKGVFNTTCQVVITVEDQDDQNPVFNSSIYRGVITSQATMHSVININPPIYAHDPDVTISEKIVYSFHGAVYHYTQWQPLITPETDVGAQSTSGQDGDILEIDPNTGVVTLISRPLSDQVYLLVQATQVDTPSRYGVALLAVEVQGTNVNAPIFSRETYAVVVTEVFPVEKVVTMVIATDPDPGSIVTYSLTDSSGTFRIKERSGDVVLIKQLSYAAKAQYVLTVTASDGTMRSSTTLTVTVWPVNNKPPVVKTPVSDLNVSLTRREKGDAVVTLRAEDEDKGTTVLSFRLLTFTDLFAINQSGVVSVRAEEDQLSLQSYPITVVVSDGGVPSYDTPVIVTVNFPPPERVAAASMADTDNILPIVLGVLAAFFFIIIVIMLVYLLRRRFRDKEHLDRVKRQNPSRDPKALTFKQKQGTVGKKAANRVKIDFRDELSEGETTVQENPLSNTKNTYFNFGQLHSDSETDVYNESDDIQVETSVIPFEGGNDDNNNDNIYNTSQGSADSEEYPTLEKNALAPFYRNGSLSTFRDSSGSELSLNVSPTDSADSKKILMPGSLARTRVPEETGGWDRNGNSIPTITNMDNLDPDTSVVPTAQKQELTVYF